ncbi:hypothetical protein EV363DRAFT_1169773, partial [Boletus edulis]
LQRGQLSLLTALIKVLDPSEKVFATHREQFYACTKDQPTGKVAKRFTGSMRTHEAASDSALACSDMAEDETHVRQGVLLSNE